MVQESRSPRHRTRSRSVRQTLLHDVQFGAAGDLLQRDRRLHLARQDRVVLFIGNVSGMYRTFPLANWATIIVGGAISRFGNNR